MDPDRWARVKEIFHAARECGPGQRNAYLQDACAGDPSLRETVESMLAREADAVSFLEAPALELEAMAVARALAEDGPSSRSATLTDISAGPAASNPVRASWRPPRARPPWWVPALAAVFLADFLLKTWCLGFGPEALGYRTRVEGGRHVITGVTLGSAAARAGMLPGDVITARDGQPYDRVAVSRVTHPNLEIGQELRFEIERDGQRRQLSMAVRRVQVRRDADGGVLVLWQGASGVMLAMAVLIGVKRPRDAVARLGALTLATLAVGLYRFNLPGGYAIAWRSVPWGLGALLWIPNACIALIGPIGLGFFARFPRPLFRARWLWGLVWLPTLCTAPVDLYTLFLRVYHPALAHAQPGLAWTTPASAGLFGLYGLAMLAAIAANYVRLTDIREKRRLRVLIVGGAVGTLPALVRFVARGFAEGSRLFEFLSSGVPDILIALLFLLFPLSFAYAVLKHRILGVAVIVRTGVQYALAKGLVISLVPVLGVLLAVDALVHGDQPLIEIVRARGSVYATLAILAVVAHTQRHRVGRAIDRRFFREHYDASRLLREVAGQVRHAGSLERAAPPVVARIEAALHPECAALLYRPAAEAEFRCIAAAPSGLTPPAISRDDPAIVRLRATDGPLDLGTRGTRELDREGRGDQPDPRHPCVELLLPIVMDPARHEAVLAFGAKRSEEPYTQEDLDYLTAIASSLALVLERPTPYPDRASSAFEECPRCGSCYDSGASRCTHEQAPLVAVGMPRTLAGRYHLEQRLGRGGMGKVYEAVDVALNRRVAVKVIRDEWVHSASALARFRREARAVAGFGHPNVVAVYDYGVEPGSRAFLVMELLKGVTLREELRRSGPLDAARTLAVLRGVCGAVGAAHRHQLVHRDLKPENIFLVGGAGCDGDGEGTTVKVLDFGVAKPLPESDEALEADGPADTETGVMVGTVGYLSPEQLLGGRPDVSWDLWALAVVAYESLTAALPFPVVSRDTWRQSVLAGRYTPLGQHLACPPARLPEFFGHALAVDRALRPSSAAAFLRDFELALD